MEPDEDADDDLVKDSDDWGDPFISFDEWASEEDEAAFADL